MTDKVSAEVRFCLEPFILLYYFMMDSICAGAIGFVFVSRFKMERN